MSTAVDAPTAPDTIEKTDTDRLFDEITRNEEQVVDNDAGDHERMSHYVSKEDIVRSSLTGAPVYALCGKKWTPTKNPENYPVCPECKAEWEKLKEQ